MLVLSRKKNEDIIIGDNIRISVVEINKNGVRLGVEAPKTVTVHRAEVQKKINEANQKKALTETGP